jgi:hypothetical protein
MSEDEKIIALYKFTRWVLDNTQDGDLCGGDVGDKAAELGLLENVIATKENEKEWANIDCVELGDTFYRYPKWLRQKP